MASSTINISLSHSGSLSQTVVPICPMGEANLGVGGAWKGLAPPFKDGTMAIAS